MQAASEMRNRSDLDEKFRFHQFRLKAVSGRRFGREKFLVNCIHGGVVGEALEDARRPA